MSFIESLLEDLLGQMTMQEKVALSARLAVAYITGLQREGIGASVKHYVCNDPEF